MSLSSHAIWRSRGACVRAGYILRNAVVMFLCRWIVGCPIQLVYPMANWVQGVVVSQAACRECEMPLTSFFLYLGRHDIVS